MKVFTNNANSIYNFYQSISAKTSQCATWLKVKSLAALGIVTNTSSSSNISVEKLINTNYIVSLKSCKTIEDAEVICLAETHNREDIRFQNAKIINTLYRPGDLVLVEELSHDPLTQPFRATKYVTVPINIKGWDCGLDDMPGLTWQLRAIHSNVNRHNHMHKIIEESLNQHPRIFVIAGRLHLYENDPLFNDKLVPPSMVQAVNNTMEFLKQKRSVVLIPRDSLDPIKESNISKTILDNSKIMQTEDSKIVRCYPGDLSKQEKSDMDAIFTDDNTIKIKFKQLPTLHVTIRRQDIFTSGAEVIVNAANSHLGGGGGIDGAIHAKGGAEYAEGHRELQREYRAEYVLGHAALIGSGSLKEKYNIENVIVVAGPQGVTTPSKEAELYSCYFNTLLLADKQNKTSIAFPSISTGIFGFPKDRAAAISLKAIQDFVDKHPNTQLKTISIHYLPNDPISDLEIFRAQIL